LPVFVTNEDYIKFKNWASLRGGTTKQSYRKQERLLHPMKNRLRNDDLFSPIIPNSFVFKKEGDFWE
jgi:hypothetical protein